MRITIIIIIVFVLGGYGSHYSFAASPAKNSRPTTRPPLIGINMDASGDTSGPARLSLSSDYVDAVTSAGGIPVLLPPVMDEAAVKRHVAVCDGFVLTGGRDVDPARFNEERHASSNPLSVRRENYDFSLIRAILSSGKPVLGVCLGCQEINVAMGGRLIQDIPTETSSTIDHKPKDRRAIAHEVYLTTGTLLADLLGTTTLGVNSVHHQACELPVMGVTQAGQAPDGIVEAYELRNHRFAVGVQWHPEALVTSHPVHLKIYEGLVKAASGSPVVEKSAARQQPRQVVSPRSRQPRSVMQQARDVKERIRRRMW